MAQVQGYFVCPECKHKNVYYYDTNVNYSMDVRGCDTVAGGCGKNCVVETIVKLETSAYKIVQ